jgi:hypothetical protein
MDGAAKAGLANYFLRHSFLDPAAHCCRTRSTGAVMRRRRKMRPRTGFAVILILAVLLLVPTIGTASDQETREAENEVSIDFGMPIFLNVVASASGGYAIPLFLNYQRVLTRHLTLSVSPSFAFLQLIYRQAMQLTLWLELDWHPFQDGLRGFFLGPAVAILYASDNLSSPDTTVSAGATAGYQFLLPANIDIDVGLGLAYGFLQTYTTQPIVLRAVLALGYRF